MHYLTDSLLGLIEENATWKVAFGFDKGDNQKVKTGGKKLTEHHQAIAAKLFPDDISGQWTADSDMKKLGLAIKNRIHR
jgi:hypothetical protein